jgi:hypothetical protein
VVRPRIDALNEKINETIAGKLSKTTRSNQKGESETIDGLRTLEVLARLCGDTEEQYFGLAKPLLDRPVPGSESDKEEVVVAGKFEWVDDPSVSLLLADHGTEDPSPEDE